MRRPKIYCDKWVHEGVCAFTQQGCKYKHEMPFDRQTQHQLGLFHGLPAWWKKHQVELQRQREPEEPVSPISAPPREGVGPRLPSLPTEQQHVWKLEGTKREVIQVHSPPSSGTPSTGSQSSPPMGFASRRPAQSVSSPGQPHGPTTPSPSTDDKTPEQRTVGFQGSPLKLPMTPLTPLTPLTPTPICVWGPIGPPQRQGMGMVEVSGGRVLPRATGEPGLLDALEADILLKASEGSVCERN